MDALFWQVAGLSLACSAVLLPLLLASRLIRGRYSARTCYFLWLLLALRLLLPLPAAQGRKTVTVEVPRYEVVLPLQMEVLAPEAPNAPEGPEEPVQSGDSALASAPGPVPAPVTAPKAAPTVSLTALLPGLWLVGMAACGLWLAVSYGLARRGLLKEARPAGAGETALLDALAQGLGCKHTPGLYRSQRVGAPVLLGLLRPVVVLPAEELPEGELSVMLCHELTHLRRRDVAYKLVLQLACVLHWFNPLVWWVGREAGRNLELCCDEDVVRGQDRAFRRSYGEILLKTAAGAGRTPVLSARMGGGKRHLKARLSNLFIKKKNGGALVCAVLVAAILGGALVSCTGELPAPVEGGQTGATNTQGPEGQDEGSKLSMDNSGALAPTGGADGRQEGPVGQQPDGRLTEEGMAIAELVNSVAVEPGGIVAFTLPSSYQGIAKWNIEMRGRMEMDDFGGMSLHVPFDFDRLDMTPGCEYSYNFAGQWESITELYLFVQLGDLSRSVDLMAIAAGETGASVEDLMGGLSELFYVRDAGGFGGDFSILLSPDGRFTYCAGGLSSYIGLGDWTIDGDILCLKDRGLGEPQYFYFEVVEGALLFQAEKSAKFMYVDVADGERFSQQPIKPAFAIQ